MQQSIRIDNIWETTTSYLRFSVSDSSDTTEIVLTPTGGDGRAFLNGFEIDSPAIKDQISFPKPEHRNERVELQDGSTTASWHAAETNGSVKYNVYLGTSPTELVSVAEGLKETSVEFTGKTELCSRAFLVC